MNSLSEPARALYDPVDGVARAVAARRWVWPLILLMASVTFAGAAFALRWDATGQVLMELSHGDGPPSASEQELSLAIVTAERVKLISGVALGLFGVPLAVLGGAAALKLLFWLLGRPAQFGQLFSVLSVALLPVALFHFLLGATELWHFTVMPDQLPTLVPSHLAALIRPPSSKLFRALAAVDFFRLWSAALLGLGLAAATGLKRARALLLSAALYGAYVAIFVLGLPGLAPGGPQ